MRPSVTQVLKPLEDWFGVPASVLEHAAERGRAVHLATQFHDEGDLDEDTVHPEVMPYLKAYYRFLEEARPEWMGIEQIVHHERMGYCGMLDRHGVLHGVKKAPECILDIKAVSVLSPATGVQTAAYDDAHPKTSRRKRARYALQLKRDETYVLKRYDEPTDLGVFVSLYNVHNWRARHGRKEQS